MKWVKRGAFALVVVVLVAVVALATWEPFFAQAGKAPPAREYRAEIIRDEWGVPHIYGKTDADVAYGVAIAHAEDDFFTLQDVIAMSRGRYGAIAGQEGAKFDYIYHLLDARGTAEREYPKLPADTRALFDAYAAGLNQYAEDHADQVKLANLFPVNGEDVAAGFVLRQPFFYGLGNVIGPLVEGRDLPHEFGEDIPGFPRKDPNVRPSDKKQANLLHPLPLGDDAALLGSNAFAIAPEKSGGPTTLISNSHQPLRGGVAWYEFSVESEDGWHFTGANFPGSPFPFLGHNEHLGWTNTVNRPDMADVYELKVTKEVSGNNHRLMYEMDGEWKPLTEKTVTLPVKVGPLVLPVQQTVYRSEHGPVIKNNKGYFAVRYGGMDSVAQLDAYYRLNKTKTLEEWQAQMARLAIPSTNFIYADEEGNIAYVYNAAIPNRPTDVKANWRSVLDGTRSDLIWQGTVGYDAIPKIINPASGWLYNSNNEPFTAAGAGSDLNPDDFPAILGIERKQTNRSRRAWKLMSEAEVLDRKTLEAIKYDTGYVREDYLDRMFDDVEAMKPDNRILDEARHLLLDWDFNADGKGRGDAIAYLMIKDFMAAEYQNGAWPDVAEKLQSAADHLMEHFGRLDPPMGELVRLRLGDVDLPLDGGSDTLRAATTWAVDDDGRLRLVHGDSFIQWVEWPKPGSAGKRVSSRSIQPFGAASTRANSPHYTDQMPLFVDHKLKPVHFWRDDVIANAKRRYIVTNKR